MTLTAAPTTPPTRRPAHAAFTESHRRRVDAPLDEVWRATLDVTPAEIRAFGPLITVRGLPARLLGRGGVADRPGHGPLLALFEDEGFVPLVRVDQGDERRVEYGAAGRFWSVTGNQPIRFDDAEGFERFDEPGHARIWFELVATRTDSGTEVTTTTCVTGTDRGAELRFAPYWALIRLPSGLIRRSWLAAIDRRARR